MKLSNIKKIIVMGLCFTILLSFSGFTTTTAANDEFVFIELPHLSLEPAPIGQIGGDFQDDQFLFIEGLAKVRQDGQWGFIDRNGNIVVPFIYDYVTAFSGGVARVVVDGKSGLIDRQGNIVLPIIYDEVWLTSRSMGNNPYGSYIRSLAQNGLIRVRKNELYGLVDKDGNIVIPVIYEFVGFGGNGEITAGQGDYFWKLDITTNSLIEINSEDISSIWNRYGLTLDVRDDKWGFVDESGNTVVPFIYDLANPFINGLSAVMRSSSSDDNFSTWGIVNTSGEEVLPTEFNFISLDNFYEGLLGVSSGFLQTARAGFIDTSGRLSIPTRFDSARDFSEGLALVWVNGETMFINTNGDVVIPNSLYYYFVDSFRNGLARVQLRGDSGDVSTSKSGFMDRNGTIVIPAEFDWNNTFSFSEGQALARRNGVWGILRSATAYVPDHTPIPTPDEPTADTTISDNDDIRVYLDGNLLTFDQPPIFRNNRILVPLRVIFEELGAEVHWVEESQRVIAIRGNIDISMQVGNHIMSINDDNIFLDVYPQLVENRVLVPVRAIAESFGADVEWNAQTQSVYITSNN